MASPEPEWYSTTQEPTPIPVTNVGFIEDHPNGYQIKYPLLGYQYDNNANIQWDIRMRNNQIGKVSFLLGFLFNWNQWWFQDFASLVHSSLY